MYGGAKLVRRGIRNLVNRVPTALYIREPRAPPRALAPFLRGKRWRRQAGARCARAALPLPYRSLSPHRARGNRHLASGFSGRKQLSINILERLELKRIPGRIKEEHGCLLTRLTLKSSAGLDDKIHSLPLKAPSQFTPVVQLQDNTEMRHGDTLTVDRIVVRSQFSRFAQCWIEM